MEVMVFKAEAKNISLTYDLSESLPFEIITDGNRLRQILINLVSNAVKYTQEGFVKVSAYLDSD